MGRILKTTDGTNWTSKTSGTTKDLEAVSFLNDNVGLVVGNGIVLMTSDAGETWTSATVNYQLLDVTYLSASQVIAVTSSGAILQSTDGGMNWTPNSFHYTAPLSKISFVDSQVGFAVGNGVILKTTDAGNHFEKFYMKYSNGTSIPVASVHAIAENRIYMVTNRGELYSVFDQAVPFIPIANFTSSKNTTCDNSGQLINFTNNGRGDYQYQWLIDKKAVATTYNFSNEFTSGGIHTVSLVAYNGVARDTSSQIIQVLSILPITKEIMLQNSGPDTLEIKSQQSYNTIQIYNLQEGVTYQVFRNGIAITSKMLAQNVDIIRYIQFQVPDVTVGGEYDFVVKAELTSTCGVGTAQKNFSRFILDVPFSPSNLTGYNLVNNGSHLEWVLQSAQTNYYQVERRAENESQFTKIGTINNYLTLASYNDAGPLVTNMRYYYRVAAGNANGLSKYSNVISVFMHGDVIYVNPNATGANNGSSWKDALKDIYQAFNETTLDDEVWVMKGTYIPDPSKKWTVRETKGILGGFNGTETLRDERNWKLNKTIFSGDIGVPGDPSDNIGQIIGILKGNLSGVTVRDDKTFGDAVIGTVSDCIFEFNDTGVAATYIDKCIIRNNNFGISISNYWRDRAEISNSFIYNNKTSGLRVSFTDAKVYNSIFYSNLQDEISQYDKSTSSVELINSIIGCMENDKHPVGTVTAPGRWNSILNKDYGIGGINVGGINYHMNYIAGDDGVLGNSDDLFYFPQPEFQNQGVILSYPEYYFFRKLDYDFVHGPRVRDDNIDIGPIEFVPDTIKVPSIQVTQTSGIVEIKWPKVQSGVTRIWLERREFDDEVVFIPLSPSVTSYVDQGVAPFKEYRYCLRLQKGSLVSFPGNKVKTDTYPKPAISASSKNNFINEVKYSYSYSYPVQLAWLQASSDTPNNFQTITTLGLSSQTTSYLDYAPKLNRYYRIVTFFDLGGGTTTSTYSDTVYVAAVINQAPTITGQTPSSVIQGNSFVLTSDLLQMHDDFNFPMGYDIQVLPGYHYTVNNFTITPESTYTGDLQVNITVSDTDLTSDVYQLVLQVKPNQKPQILDQVSIKIIQGNGYNIQLSDLTLFDDYNFPVGATLEVLSDAAYTISNDNSIFTPNSFSGTVEVLIHVSDGFQYSDIFKFKIFVDPIIQGDFSASKTNIMAGDAVDFVSTFSGSPTSWLWEFDGATPATSDVSNPVNISYEVPGTYKVQLTLHDDLQNVVIIKGGYIVVSAITAVEDNLAEEASLYPNPSSGEFYVYSKGKILNFDSIEITDLIGKKADAFSTQVDAHTAKLKLPGGEYIVSFSVEGTWFHRKVIVR